MRRSIAVLLLFIHLITTGACAVSLEFFVQPDVQMVKQLYNSKEDKNLIEIKIPVHLHGISAWTAYEKIRGQIKLKNADYVYVSLKMSQDTMSLLCVPNKGKCQLTNANIIMAKNIADVPVGKKAHNNSSKKTLDSQYNSQTFTYNFTVLPLVANSNCSKQHLNLLNPYLATKGQPPDKSC